VGWWSWMESSSDAVIWPRASSVTSDIGDLLLRLVDSLGRRVFEHPTATDVVVGLAQNWFMIIFGYLRGTRQVPIESY
jgi:hypothetical protein